MENYANILSVLTASFMVANLTLGLLLTLYICFNLEPGRRAWLLLVVKPIFLALFVIFLYAQGQFARAFPALWVAAPQLKSWELAAVCSGVFLLLSLIFDVLVLKRLRQRISRTSNDRQ